AGSTPTPTGASPPRSRRGSPRAATVPTAHAPCRPPPPALAGPAGRRERTASRAFGMRIPPADHGDDTPASSTMSSGSRGMRWRCLAPATIAGCQGVTLTAGALAAGELTGQAGSSTRTFQPPPIHWRPDYVRCAVVVRESPPLPRYGAMLGLAASDRPRFVT